VTNIATSTELSSLMNKSLGDSNVCIAILDGAADLSHPCFAGANLSRLPTLVSDVASSGLMSGHGTHITSIIFGQKDSPVSGIAPKCRGLIVPVFSDQQRGKLSQMDLARAINQAVEAGAHVINISGGQLSQSGDADPILVEAVRFCNNEGVLIVAAAGNDACECLHVPAALPSVLAVGAMNAQGLPVDYSNWGKIYQYQGILAPGENILGAKPGGGVVRRSGTSFATPIVSGIVARLLSVQLAQGEKPNPHAIREAILKTVLPCNPEIVEDCRRFLAGTLNISGAYTLITKGGLAQVSEPNSEEVVVQPSQVEDFTPEETSSINEIQQLEPSEAIAPSSEQVSFESPEIGIQAAEVTNPESSMTTNIQHSENPMSVTSSNLATSSVAPSGDCGCNEGTVASSVTPSNAPMSLVYALGTIGYDFGTEARRDSFKQLMPMVWSDNGDPVPSPIPIEPPRSGIFPVPANPYDARQMARYLEGKISEAASLIWTLNLELTPIYAIKPQAPFASDVYRYFQEFLAEQVLDKEDPNHIEKVSIPAVLTGETVTLFSGQVVPVIAPLNVRGMYGWKVNQLIDSIIAAIQNQKCGSTIPSEKEEIIKYSLRNFLMRIYYDLRNLGQTSMDRAQNFAATNVFQYADALVTILSNQNSEDDDSKGVTMQLDGFGVERSPFCRKDSDCWDVKIKFFDPENNKRAKKVLRYTIDVSDIMPVTMGEPRTWDVAN